MLLHYQIRICIPGHYKLTWIGQLHTWDFHLKGIEGNMRCKLLQKRSTEKTECSKHLQYIAIEKKIFFQSLTDAFFKYL